MDLVIKNRPCPHWAIGHTLNHRTTYPLQHVRQRHSGVAHGAVQDTAPPAAGTDTVHMGELTLLSQASQLDRAANAPVLGRSSMIVLAAGGEGYDTV
jgi:hypothetical protein